MFLSSSAPQAVAQEVYPPNIAPNSPSTAHHILRTVYKILNNPGVQPSAYNPKRLLLASPLPQAPQMLPTALRGDLIRTDTSSNILAGLPKGHTVNSGWNELCQVMDLCRGGEVFSPLACISYTPKEPGLSGVLRPQ